MKIAIVGSRQYPRLELVDALVEGLPRDTIVVSGGAAGVDSVAERAARQRGLETEIFPADWARFGRKAGPLRNASIVAAAEQVVAFWDGASRGTLNTVVQAAKAGRTVRIIGADGQDVDLPTALAAAARAGVLG